MRLRAGLVVLQFSLAVAMIASTAVVHQQLRFMQEKDAGFEADRIVWWRIGYPGVRAVAMAMREQILSHPGVESVSFFDQVPGTRHPPGTMRVWRVGSEQEAIDTQGLDAGPRFLQMMGARVLAGRLPADTRKLDRTDAVILNHTAMERLGLKLETAVGTAVNAEWGGSRHVIGVIDDFHLESLHHSVKPLLIFATSTGPDFSYMGARLRPDPESMNFLAETWNHFVPHMPLRVSLLSDDVARQYRGEERLQKILSMATILAIGLASVGLFGLSVLAAEARTKEVGIRKVVGATETQLVMLLTRDFAKMVLIASQLIQITTMESGGFQM